ncbi:MAG: hypothetical protein KDC44_09780, partial [Phaeodactylibacter sp.]|nr:hypothetical protein [Phaeodactylibacter sp.]
NNTLNVDGLTDLNAGLNVNNASPTNLSGTLDVDGATDLNNTLNVDGLTDLNAGLNVNNASPTNLTGTLEVDGMTDLNADLTVNNMAATYLTGTLDVDKATNLNSTLTVDGGTDLNAALTVNNMAATYLTGTLDVDKATNLNSTLTVDGATELNDKLEVDGTTDLNASLTVDGATNLNSTLTVVNDADFNADVEIDGELTVNDDLNFNGQVTINGGVSGGQSSYDSYQLRVEGGNQGVAIKANDWDKSSNFISFYTGSTMRGRIEAQDFQNLQNSFEYGWINAMSAVDEALVIAEGIACGAQLDLAEAAVMIAEGIAVATEWIEWITNSENNVGVSYQSGSGDYAEWLEKANLAEVFRAGDIVAVSNGKISKQTAKGDHYMVVSLSPIVLGNMPPEAEKANYEMVAFMGQVPVRVLGPVNAGDYILPSGNNDGIGRAVAREQMQIDEYQKIVGVAWTGSQSAGVNLINLAIGLNVNDLAIQLKKQEEELKALHSQVEDILAYLESGGQKPQPSATPEVQTQPETPVTPAAITASSSFFSAARADALLQKIEAKPEIFEQAITQIRSAIEARGVEIDQVPGWQEMLGGVEGYKAYIKAH